MFQRQATPSFSDWRVSVFLRHRVSMTMTKSEFRGHPARSPRVMESMEDQPMPLYDATRWRSHKGQCNRHRERRCEGLCMELQER
mmetsp:Transcript_17603/g.39842  ORF Transcript_17603/g.39842 Transcript_17603/m.39842 type:complete len:85 (+) Transcript_17603:318-572(+)